MTAATDTRQGNPLVLWGVGLLLVGLLPFFHGCARFVSGGGHVLGAEVAEGRIVEVRTREFDHRGRGMATTSEVTVEFAAGGKTLRVDDNTGATGAERGKGEVVRVYYDAAAPEKALVGGTAPFSGIQYIIEWLAGCIAIAGAAYLMYRGATSKAKESR